MYIIENLNKYPVRFARFSVTILIEKFQIWELYILFHAAFFFFIMSVDKQILDGQLYKLIHWGNNLGNQGMKWCSQLITSPTLLFCPPHTMLCLYEKKDPVKQKYMYYEYDQYFEIL